jgi:hypothetical protein
MLPHKNMEKLTTNDVYTHEYDERFDAHYWRKNGNIHRDGDQPAYVCDKHGYQEWYKNGLLHREDGPALISRYTKRWYINGRLHREDGPAVYHPHEEYEEWHTNGQLIKVIHDGETFVPK